MSYFPGLKLTKQGEQLLAKVNGNLNETITFKRAELGSEIIVSDDEIRFLTKLKEKWKEVSISDCKIIGEEQTQVQLELQFDNGDMEIEKIFREIGIYVASKDGEEILFAYSNAKENYDYIPPATDNPQSFIINILIAITSNVKINAEIDLNSYVTIKKFNEDILSYLNSQIEYNELNKIATPTELGRIKVGNNLTITEDGVLNVLVASPESLPPIVEKYKGAGA